MSCSYSQRKLNDSQSAFLSFHLWTLSGDCEVLEFKIIGKWSLPHSSLWTSNIKSKNRVGLVIVRSSEVCFLVAGCIYDIDLLLKSDRLLLIRRSSICPGQEDWEWWYNQIKSYCVGTWSPKNVMLLNRFTIQCSWYFDVLDCLHGTNNNISCINISV